jgi:ribosome modulation factor
MTDTNHTMSAEDARVLFELSRLKHQKEVMASKTGEYRSALSRLESKGLNKKAAQEAIKIRDKGEVAETLAYITALTKYLKLLGLPIQKEQADLFEFAPALQPIEERARELGTGAGILGEPLSDNPHDASTAAGQAWIAGWHEGVEMRDRMHDEDAADAEIIPGDEDDEIDDGEEDAAA